MRERGSRFRQKPDTRCALFRRLLRSSFFLLLLPFWSRVRRTRSLTWSSTPHSPAARFVYGGSRPLIEPAGLTPKKRPCSSARLVRKPEVPCFQPRRLTWTLLARSTVSLG